MNWLRSVLSWQPFPFPQLSGLPRTVRWGAFVASLAVGWSILWAGSRTQSVVAMFASLVVAVYVGAPLAATAVRTAYYRHLHRSGR